MPKNKYTPKPKNKDKYKNKPTTSMVGTLDITRSGMGYVVLNQPDTKDILVRPQDMATALDGDTVEVKITKMSPTSDRREGRITKVISRRQTEFIGTLSVSDNYAFFIASGEKPMPDIYIPNGKYKKLPDNSKVIVRLVEWENKDRKPVGEVVCAVNAENENDFAMNALLTNSGFTIGFSQEVLAETASLPKQISEQEIQLRKDFRETLTITIDPADAKDFDDAISFRKIDKTWFEIGVHIADVSHYVTPGSALDKEAALRATSVYLPDRVNPMLPEHISNILCSLRPGEDKLTFSAVFTMNKKGKIKDTWIGKSLIHSDHRYAYEEVQEIIEGADGPYKEEILWLNEMSQLLRSERFQKGAINFSSQEVKFKLDENGKPIGIEIKESRPAHQLIEELMLLANKTVAKYAASIKVDGKPFPFPYRVHDQPDEDKFASFVPFARKYGYQFDLSTPAKIAESFNTMLEKAHGKPEQHLLEQLGIRTMAKAVYTAENIGHYGLGFEDYCHFTSPIRRYPDVLVHRLLETCLQGHPQVDKQLEEKCKHCSDRERAAMECERAGNKYKQVEYMQQYLGETFSGVVSGVAEFGFWVETVNEKCEGLVSVHTLNEPFDYVATEYMLEGEFTHKKIQMGDPVTIQVVAANLEKRQLDYHLVVPESESVGLPPFTPNSRQGRSQGRSQGRAQSRSDRSGRGQRQEGEKGKDNQRSGRQDGHAKGGGHKNARPERGGGQRPSAAKGTDDLPLALSRDSENASAPAGDQPSSGAKAVPVKGNNSTSQKAKTKKPVSVTDKVEGKVAGNKKDSNADGQVQHQESSALPIKAPAKKKTSKVGQKKEK
ncbi:MAG TPA: ribonuclease R [Arachidicoccus sp.]|nr:ribonuclease R [Arachidicoccus sp.]